MKLFLLGSLLAGVALVTAGPLPAPAGFSAETAFAAPPSTATEPEPPPGAATTSSNECCRAALAADTSGQIAQVASAPEPPNMLIFLVGVLSVAAFRYVRGSQRRMPKS